METSPPNPAADPPTHLYHQLVHTLTALLPPPLEDTQEALRIRNNAAIAKVAALLPVNANEADLAAQCIAARAQAEDILRLLRQHPNDIALTIRLNAQYGSMVRTSLSVLARLTRLQASRQKREAVAEAANEDAWTMHIAERSMLNVMNAPAEPRKAAPPEPTIAEPPSTYKDQPTQNNVSEMEPNSHNTAFETLLSTQYWNPQSTPPAKPALPKDVLEASVELPTITWEAPERSRRAQPDKSVCHVG